LGARESLRTWRPATPPIRRINYSSEAQAISVNLLQNKNRRLITAMAKLIMGWFMVVFGVFATLCGAVVLIGGDALGTAVQLLGIGLGITVFGWRLRARP